MAPRRDLYYAGNVFPPMVRVVKPRTVGEAAVDHFTISRGEAGLYNLGSFRTPWLHVSPGDYARLKIGGVTVMSDTTMERRSNLGFATRAHGDVLVGGLGLGMVLVPVLRKEEVSTVTVVERSADVIAAVEDQVRQFVGWRAARKLTVVCSDVDDYQPSGKFDVIYFDIWHDICGDNLPHVARLHQRFKSRLRRGGPRVPWMGSWMAEHLRDLRKRGA